MKAILQRDGWKFVALVALLVVLGVVIRNDLFPPAPPDLTHLKDMSWVRVQFHDIAYATKSNAQKFDLYIPNDGQPPYRVIVAIHGGTFMFGDKGDYQQNGPIESLRHGYAVASINYRLEHEAPFPAAVQDVKAAIRFLRANGASYHLDPHCIVAWGDSAGAYLAVMAGVTGATREFDDPALGNADVPSHVQAVIDWFGPMEFASIDHQFAQSGKGPGGHGDPGSPESIFLGSPINSAPAELLQRANPTTYLGTGLPPFLVQHGDADSIVPLEQSIELVEKLKVWLPPSGLQFDILHGAQHGDLLFETPANLDRVFAFLDTALGAGCQQTTKTLVKPGDC